MPGHAVTVNAMRPQFSDIAALAARQAAPAKEQHNACCSPLVIHLTMRFLLKLLSLFIALTSMAAMLSENNHQLFSEENVMQLLLTSVLAAILAGIATFQYYAFLEGAADVDIMAVDDRHQRHRLQHVVLNVLSRKRMLQRLSSRHLPEALPGQRGRSSPCVYASFSKFIGIVGPMSAGLTYTAGSTLYLWPTNRYAAASVGAITLALTGLKNRVAEQAAVYRYLTGKTLKPSPILTGLYRVLIVAYPLFEATLGAYVFMSFLIDLLQLSALSALEQGVVVGASSLLLGLPVFAVLKVLYSYYDMAKLKQHLNQREQAVSADQTSCVPNLKCADKAIDAVLLSIVGPLLQYNWAFGLFTLLAYSSRSSALLLRFAQDILRLPLFASGMFAVAGAVMGGIAGVVAFAKKHKRLPASLLSDHGCFRSVGGTTAPRVVVRADDEKLALSANPLRVTSTP